MRWGKFRKGMLKICMIQAKHISSREDTNFKDTYGDRFHRY
jgi:hypothetical protein